MNDTYLIEQSTLTQLSDAINVALDREESDRISYTPIEMNEMILHAIPAYYNEKIEQASSTADRFGPIEIGGLRYEPIAGTKEFQCVGYVNTLITGEPIVNTKNNTAETGTNGLLYQANIQENIGADFKVTRITDRALKDINNKKWRLKKVSIPGSIHIALGNTNQGGDSRLFQASQALEEVVIGEGLDNLGYMMFDGCVSLSNLTLPESLEAIDVGALKKTNLTTITIPKNVKKIEQQALTISPLKTVYFDSDGGRFINDPAPDITLNNIFIPSTNSDGTIAVQCNSLTDIYVPWSEGEVVGVSSNSVWGATNNPTIHYEYNIIKYDYNDYNDTLKCVGYGATMPDEFTIPEKYQGKTISFIDTLQYGITAPPNVKKINLCINGGPGYGGIGEAMGLKTIYIGPKVQCFAEYGLGYTPNLQTIILDPDNPYFQLKSNCLMTMDDIIVGACRNSVIPDDATGIEYGAFSCYDIPELWIPETVNYIASYAFNNNTIVYMPWTRQEAEEMGLLDNEEYWGAKEIVFKEKSDFTYSLNEDGQSYTLTGYNGNTQITQLPSTHNNKPITTIGDSAFLGCQYLPEALSLPSNISTIKDHAFDGINSRYIYIESTVEYIGAAAFAQNNNTYMNIYLHTSYAEDIVINQDAFMGCNVYTYSWQHQFDYVPEERWSANSIYYHEHYLPSGPTTFNIGANCLNQSTRSEYDWYNGNYTQLAISRTNNTYRIAIDNPDPWCNHIRDINSFHEGQITYENQYESLYSYDYTNQGTTLVITVTGTVDDNKLLHILDEYASEGYFLEVDPVMGEWEWSGSITEMSSSYDYVTKNIPLGEAQSTWYTDQEWQTETFIESPTWSAFGLVLVHHSTGRTYSIPESYEGTSVYIEQSTVNTSAEQTDTYWHEAWLETTNTSELNQWIAGCLEVDGYEVYYSGSPVDLKQYFTIYCDE